MYQINLTFLRVRLVSNISLFCFFFLCTKTGYGAVREIEQILRYWDDLQLTQLFVGRIRQTSLRRSLRRRLRVDRLAERKASRIACVGFYFYPIEQKSIIFKAR